MTTEEKVLQQAKELILEAQQIVDNPNLVDVDSLDMRISALVSIVNQFYVDHDARAQKFKVMGKDMLEIARSLRRTHETLLQEKFVNRA